ncbi:MAG: hypothetical protein P1V97_06060, partial [Planctomycetota bacterium]|nr:hypothetical protein [Planctomycetota bacterium]
MRDKELADLERQVQAAPEDLGLRAQLYRALIRAGQASEDALKWAAMLGDPAAKLHSPKRFQGIPVFTDEHLKTLKQLPLLHLNFRLTETIADKSLLEPEFYNRLMTTDHNTITDEGMIHLAEKPLK